MSGHTRFVRIGGTPPVHVPVRPLPPPTPELLLDSTVGTVTGAVLEAGKTYTVTVTGTVSDWNRTLPGGTPEADAMFPTTGGTKRTTTEVGLDAETVFADPSTLAHKLGHWTQFQIDTGSGFAHIEPHGGPYTEPVSGHSYTYTLTGEGQAVVFRWADSPLTDNYGAFSISVE